MLLMKQCHQSGWRNSMRRTRVATLTGVACAVLLASACGANSSNGAVAGTAGGTVETASGGSASAAPAGPVGATSNWCETVKEKFPNLAGTTVSVYSPASGTD